MTEYIPIGGDCDVTYDGAQPRTGGSYLNSGTCTYALKDADGNAVASGTGTLSYVAASDGNYLGVIDAAVTATLTPDAWYYVEITFSQGGYNDFRRLKRQARYRRND